MNAILVAVNYDACLTLTLPYNRHHFDRVVVVTDDGDAGDRTRRIALPHGCEVFHTDAFYRRGAMFNKWLALEEGLDACKLRTGWLCVMDADVLWPKDLPRTWQPGREYPGFGYREGCLYTPRRRMYPTIPQEVPPEEEWGRYPLHRNEAEFAGYSQVFHCSDPALPPAPWHETNWIHAGGADSFFQRRWPESRKVRPPFEVLHLGPAGENWCGVGGKTVLRDMLLERRRRPPADRYGHEKLR